jgi:hypothetical protein
MSGEAGMNKPVLLAIMLTALPAAAPAQEGKADSVSPRLRCTDPREAPLAAGALPARASTVPEPQRGTVAPGTRVPSETVTPSSRAMAAVSARGEKTTNEKENADARCRRIIAPDLFEAGGAAGKDG